MVISEESMQCFILYNKQSESVSLSITSTEGNEEVSAEVPLLLTMIADDE